MFLPVMANKNIFVYKFFLLLNISDFGLFFWWKLQAPPPLSSRKIHPLFPSNAPLKIKILWSPPLLEHLVGGSISMNELYLNLKMMTQFHMTTIIEKLQDMSRNKHLLISEVEKNARLPQMPKVTASTLRYFR